MSFNINPCKACWDKYSKEKCNINTINSCVAETAAAFSGISSNNFLIGTDADTNWQSCMEKMMSAEGRSKCDFQLHMAPVFNQAPHYFPTLLYEEKNPDKALGMCEQKCNDLKFNRKTCIENCITDRMAVEIPVKTNENRVNKKIHKNICKSMSTKPGNQKSVRIIIPAIVILVLVISGIILYRNSH